MLGDTTALVIGANCDSVVKQVGSVKGLGKLVHFKGHENFVRAQPEELAPIIVALQKKSGFTHVIASHSSFGKNVLPRVAALLDKQAISDVTGIVDQDTFVRPIYAGNAVATVKSKDSVKILTVRGTAFDDPQLGESSIAAESFEFNEKSMYVFLLLSSFLTRSSVPTIPSSTWISSEVRKSDRPDLSAARVVISGGRALKSAENFKLMEQLADVLSGAGSVSFYC